MRPSTADSNTSAASPWASGTSPTTSPDPSWRPEDSDPDYTLDPEEPLNLNQATSFRGATFKSKIAIKPITTYRSWSDPDYEAGSYVSRTRPAGPLQTQLDLALAPQWGNKANHISEYEIPQFAPFYEGAAGVQPVKAIKGSDTLGQLPGGGNQILIIDEQVKNQWKTKK